MLREIFSKIKMKLLISQLIWKGNSFDFQTVIDKSDESIMEIRKSEVKKSRIYIRKKSSLIINEGSQILNSSIFIDRNSKLIIGENCKLIDTEISITNQSVVLIGSNCLISSSICNNQNSFKVTYGSVNFGENVNIRGNVNIDHGVLNIGSNSFLNHGSEIRCEEKINIGEYVFISYNVDIYDTNTHSKDWKVRQQEVIDGFPNNTFRKVKPLTKPITIGNNVWVGKNCVILKGCSIGSRSIIGTRAVVTKSFPEDSLICGNPAKLIEKIDSSFGSMEF